jgi:mono/diheme cytochrome c family protein
MRLQPSFLALLALPAFLVAWGARAPESPARPAPQPPAFAGAAFLQKHCVRCHGEKVKKADLALHAFRDEASVAAGRKVFKNVLDAVRAGDMPPASRPRPTADELAAFTAAVTAVFDRADRNARPDPGRVTLRRLNRTEYNNTIRDLVGVDFNPAEDFPSDDVGHGFDNIGDVLTIAPVLMERYLAAAESITQRAILANVPKPAQRYVGSRWLEPATPKAYKWRPLSAKGKFHTPFSAHLDGEYQLRVRAYGESPDAEPVRIALSVDGKVVKTFDVTATQKNPAVYETTLQLKKGQRRAAVALLNPTPKKEKPRTLHVEWLALIGPADTRPPSHRRLLASTAKTKKGQTAEVLRRFASRAYRRPATADEVARLVRLVETAEGRGERWEAAMQLAMQAVLVSPKFLFRLELDDRPETPRPHPLDEYQLASRLSYFLWSSMPDDELFALAGKKQLTANLDAQVRRMLKDPKAAALVENFALQWLQLRRLKTVSPDARLFPSFNEELRAAMLKETELFFAEIVREDRSVLDLIDGNFTYLNNVLSWHYGITDSKGTRWGGQRKPGSRRFLTREFVRVELPEGDDRRGVLSHASVLTVTSNPTRTSPVKRGKWVLEQILGAPPPPPPPDVPELVEGDKAVLSGSLRQRMEQHRKNPSCANCHAKMDPIGFAFENYDAVGKYRATDGKFRIDPSGTLPGGKTFKGPAELKKILMEKKDLFARCLTEKMMIYALGRGLEYYDRPAVDGAVAALAKKNYKFSALVGAIVQSFPFRMRRGKDQSR